MSPTSDTNEPAETQRPLRDGIDNAIESARTKAHDAAEIARETASRAIGQAKDGLGQARETLADTYATSREKASEAYAAAREKTRAAGKSAAGGLDTNPIAALTAGIALGAAIAALLPRTDAEKRALGTVGAKLNGAAKDAIGAARDAGKDKLAELGLTPDKARETMRSLIDGALAAATTAGTAAADKARESATKARPAT